MKKLIIVLFLMMSVCAWAGEREELEWQLRYFKEKVLRLQMDHSVAVAAHNEVAAKLKAVIEKEKKERAAKDAKNNKPER